MTQKWLYFCILFLKFQSKSTSSGNCFHFLAMHFYTNAIFIQFPCIKSTSHMKASQNFFSHENVIHKHTCNLKISHFTSFSLRIIQLFQPFLQNSLALLSIFTFLFHHQVNFNFRFWSKSVNQYQFHFRKMFCVSIHKRPLTLYCLLVMWTVLTYIVWHIFELFWQYISVPYIWLSLSFINITLF